jgi:hypothetical protein
MMVHRGDTEDTEGLAAVLRVLAMTFSAQRTAHSVESLHPA